MHKVIHNRTGKQDISGKIIRNSSALWITFIDNPKKFRHFFGKTYVKAELLLRPASDGRKPLQKGYPYDTIIEADNDKKITIVVDLVM